MFYFHLDNFSKSKLFLRLIALLMVVILSGCVKPRVFPRYMTVSDVVNNIKCQLFLAVIESPRPSDWPDNWVANFDLTLKVFRQGKLTGDVTYVVPHLGGLASLNLTTGFDKSGKSELNFGMAPVELSAFVRHDHCSYFSELRKRKYLAGELGVSLWLRNFLEGIDKSQFNMRKSFSYSIEFIVNLDGSITPKIDRTRTNLHRLVGSLTASRNRKDTHTLIFNFSRIVGDPPDIVLLRQIRDQISRQSDLNLEKFIAMKAALDSEINRLKEMIAELKTGNLNKRRELLSSSDYQKYLPKSDQSQISVPFATRPAPQVNNIANDALSKMNEELGNLERTRDDVSDLRRRTPVQQRPSFRRSRPGGVSKGTQDSLDRQLTRDLLRNIN